MEVASAQPATGAGSTQASPSTRSAAATTGGGTAITSDFETFLQMLTVQMENQDPLNPIASEDLAVQLATFSGVEQQVLTNHLLEGIAQTLDQDVLNSLADWIGMEVRATGPITFDGTPLTMATSIVPGAEAAALVVRDSSGTEVQRLALSVDTGHITWAGVDENGTPLPPGSYSFEVESYAGEELLATISAEGYHRIVEARHEEGGIMLVAADGSTIPAEEVSAIRAPQGA